MTQRTIWHAVCFGLVCALLGLGPRLLKAGRRPTGAAPAATAQEARLATFLRRYIGPRDSDNNRDTRYQSAFVDLTGHGAREVIVYLIGQQWCGSGGCTTLVLSPKGSSYRVVTYMTITNPPIRVLEAESHGWHDIAVWVEGGGTEPGYEALLRYNGKTYPSNPSVPPARKLTKRLPGRVVIARAPLETANRLYP